MEFFEEAEDVGDGQFAAAAVDELNGLAALQIDAGNQHGRRTSIFSRRQIILEFANGLDVVVEDGGGEGCVGCAFAERFRQSVRGVLRHRRR